MWAAEHAANTSAHVTLIIINLLIIGWALLLEAFDNSEEQIEARQKAENLLDKQAVRQPVRSDSSENRRLPLKGAMPHAGPIELRSPDHFDLHGQPFVRAISCTFSISVVTLDRRISSGAEFPFFPKYLFNPSRSCNRARHSRAFTAT